MFAAWSISAVVVTIFFRAVKFFPAIRKAVIFDVDFVINVVRTVTAWIVYISAVYTHIHIHAYLCAYQPLKPKRHFSRSAANKEIWHLEAIRRAVIFVINGGQDGHCVKRIYIGSIHTHSYTRIFLLRSAINLTFCE